MEVLFVILLFFVFAPLLALSIVGIVKSRNPAQKALSIVACVVVSVFVFGCTGVLAEEDEETSDSKEEVTEKQTEPSDNYLKVSVDKLVNDLNANAYAASQKYDGEDVEITGRVNYIDADGWSISLEPTNDEWSLQSVTCYVFGKKQKEFVSSVSVGDIVTVRGEITDVDELFGYYLNVDEFVD